MFETSYPLWSSASEYALMASRHRSTGEHTFPALDDSSPLKDDFDVVPVAAAGTVYSYTVIHPSARSGEAPYALGLVDLPGPVRVFGRLVGKARPAIGDLYVARRDDQFGYVFASVDA